MHKKSNFDDILAARRTKASSEANSSTPNHLITQVSNQGSRKRGKYDDPDYTRVTFYIRRDTDMQVRQKLLGQGKRELSDIFQRLAEGWIAGQFEV